MANKVKRWKNKNSSKATLYTAKMTDAMCGGMQSEITGCGAHKIRKNPSRQQNRQEGRSYLGKW